MHPQHLNLIGADRVEAMADEARRSRLLADTRAPGDDFAWARPARVTFGSRVARFVRGFARAGVHRGMSGSARVRTTAR